MDYRKKKEKLNRMFRELTRENVAVAFSGGVDSSLILKLAVLHAGENGTKVYALTAQTELHPMEDMELSMKIAEEIGAQHRIIPVKELKSAGIDQNPEDRCYRCKRLIFDTFLKQAEALGIHTVLEGTNLDDTKVYRPGLRALTELGIKSPLKDVGFTKEEVRALAGEYGLSTASRPAAPCMATRFPYGTHLTAEKLRRVEEGEVFLKSLGFDMLRLRVHENVARLEVPPDRMEKVFEYREEILGKLKDLGYDYITLDLAGFRSGSMDEVLKAPENG